MSKIKLILYGVRFTAKDGEPEVWAMNTDGELISSFSYRELNYRMTYGGVLIRDFKIVPFDTITAEIVEDENKD